MLVLPLLLENSRRVSHEQFVAIIYRINEMHFMAKSEKTFNMKTSTVVVQVRSVINLSAVLTCFE